MKIQINPRKRHHRLGARLRAGFSLVELLIVIAVIGIIAAIAIPNIANVTGAAQTSTYQRNAQNIASVAASAKAAGWTASGTKATDLTAIIATTGVSPTTGSFAGQVFSAPMSNADANSASVYLTDDLVYVAAGGQTATTLP